MEDFKVAHLELVNCRPRVASEALVGLSTSGAAYLRKYYTRSWGIVATVIGLRLGQ